MKHIDYGHLAIQVFSPVFPTNISNRKDFKFHLIEIDGSKINMTLLPRFDLFSNTWIL